MWLTRNQMSKLFGRDVKTIGKHINNALHEELEKNSVVANFATTAADGKIRSCLEKKRTIPLREV